MRSCIVCSNPSGMFTGHWSRRLAMLRSSFSDLALRRQWNHRTKTFADEFNVFQKYAILVVYVHRAAVSLPFQIYCLKMLVEAGLVAFSNACFEFADGGPEEAQHGSLANLPKIVSSHLHGFSKVAM